MLTDRNMRIKPRGKIYSLNEGYANKWDDAVREYVNSKKACPVSPKCPARSAGQVSRTVFTDAWCSRWSETQASLGVVRWRCRLPIVFSTASRVA